MNDNPNINIYIVIGGVKDDTEVNDDNAIMYAICSDSNCDNLEWKQNFIDIPELEELLDEHTCASYKKENGACEIMVIDNNKYFRLWQSCDSNSCSFHLEDTALEMSAWTPKERKMIN